MRTDRVIILFTFFIFFCCTTVTEKPEPELKSEYVKYARGFNIEFLDNYKKLTVTRLFKGSTATETYYLHNEDPEDIPSDGIGIKVPVNSLVCSSTTHLPSLVLLGESNSLTGFPSVRYVSAPVIRERIESGAVQDLGTENGMNVEGIVELSPELMMGYLMTSDSKVYDKIEASGIPVVINSDYLEESPLGRAEWIKFIAAFFNKEAMADSIFSAIEKNYLNIKNLTMNIESRPTVFSGVMYGGTWYMPGGRSFAGIFLEDAGGDYLWSDNQENGSLQISFEIVLEKAHDANFWISASNFRSKQEMSQSDERYQLFRAFQEDRIFTYTLSENEGGGNDFFEMGYARPDWVLSDMVKILHPGLLQDEEFHFFEKVAN